MVTKKTTKTATKTTAVGGATGIISTYLAVRWSTKYGIPLEVTSLIGGAVVATATRWAGKLIP